MTLFREKKRKSWQKITFSHQQTKTGLLTREQVRSRRVARITMLLGFALGVTFVVGIGVLGSAWEKWLGLLLVLR